MGVLEQITNLKKQGKVDKEIIEDLSQKGISPKEISEGLKQFQIKSAVSDFNEELEPSINIDDPLPIPINKKETPEEFSTGKQTTQNSPYQENYYSPEQKQFSQGQYSPDQYQQEQDSSEQYSQEQSPFQGNYSSYAPLENNTDNIIEIADQIFSDRIRKFQRQGDINTENIALFQTKLEGMSERLKKIETIIDKLQIAILEKVGSYGQNLESVKKEMSMMQDSFSKMISSPKEGILQKSSFDEKDNIRESLRNIAKNKL